MSSRTCISLIECNFYGTDCVYAVNGLKIKPGKPTGKIGERLLIIPETEMITL